MKKLILSVALLSATLAQAVTVKTQSPSIDANNHVIISAADLPKQDRAWVAIYPKDAKSTFANIVKYRFTHGVTSWKFDMGTIPAGEYEARAYDAGSWTPTDRFRFTVVGQAAETSVTTTKETFSTQESVHATISNLPGNYHDWVAIYPVGAQSTFANIVAYQFTHGTQNGDFDFGTIPAGEYEMRVFQANSWRAASIHTFKVEGANISPTVTTDKEQYSLDDIVVTTITNMPGNDRDWVGIFKKGASNTFANIVVYRFTHGLKNGYIKIGTLPRGEYEARVFYAHSWRVKDSHAFQVGADKYDDDAVLRNIQTILAGDYKVDKNNYAISTNRNYAAVRIDGQSQGEPFNYIKLYDISDYFGAPVEVAEIYSFYLAGMVNGTLKINDNDLVTFTRFDDQNRQFAVEYSISQKRIINEQRL